MSWRQSLFFLANVRGVRGVRDIVVRCRRRCELCNVCMCMAGIDSLIRGGRKKIANTQKKQEQ